MWTVNVTMTQQLMCMPVAFGADPRPEALETGAFTPADGWPKNSAGA